MKPVVSLREVVEEMDVMSSEWTAYLNRRTGELFTVTDEDLRIAEASEDELEDLPEWEQERLPKIREVLDSKDVVALPEKEELDEYALMQRFSMGVEDRAVSDELLRAIQGRGAFRRFREVARERGLLDSWYQCRQKALEEIAEEWLERNGIAFTREA